jgi:hypothetical protein
MQGSITYRRWRGGEADSRRRVKSRQWSRTGEQFRCHRRSPVMAIPSYMLHVQLGSPWSTRLSHGVAPG